MSWTDDDVARSVRRYLSLMLDGPPWRLRVDRREVRDDDRPVAVVQTGEQSVLRARESLNQGEVTTLLPVTVTAYPEPVDDPKESARTARRLRADLGALLVYGLSVEDGAGRAWAGPFRVPLWDYAETPLEGAGKEMAADPHDVLVVQRESVGVTAVQDPDDPRRWAVILNFRVEVEAPGREIPAGPPVAEFGGEFAS